MFHLLDHALALLTVFLPVTLLLGIFGIDDALLGGLLAGGGSALSGLFGGSNDPGPSAALQNSRGDVFNQMSRYLDAFYGSNWRQAAGSGYGDNGVAGLIAGHEGAGDTFANYDYTPGGRAAGGGPGAPGSSGGRAGAGNGQLSGGTTPFGNKPILQQLEESSAAGLADDRNYMNQFDRESSLLDRQGNVSNKLAAKFGTGREAVIRSDADKALTGANRLSIARATSMGLGGATTTLDELGGNAAGNFREMQRALADNQAQATGLRIQTNNSEVGRRMQRSGARAGLYNEMAGRADTYRMRPIQGQINTLGSPVVNPYSVGGGSAPVNSGNLATTLGGTAGQIGGLLLAKGLFSQGAPGGGGASTAGYGGSNYAGSSVYNGGYGNYYCDRRLKTAIESLGGEFPDLHIFEYTKAAIKSGRGKPGRWLGYMAQDLRRLNPALVAKDARGFLRSTIPAVRIG